MSVLHNTKGQAVPAATRHFGAEAFASIPHTEVHWLGNAGALVNSRGTTVMVDPVLSGFDMPLLIEVPITEEQVPGVDAVLLTHCDNDHYSRKTCGELASKVKAFHAPHYVAGLLQSELGIPGKGHDIGGKFNVGNIVVTLTPAWHNWQNESPKHHTREYLREDYCGFWLDTPDGSIWAVGGSRLLQEQLDMPHPDANLILWHWGSVDAPDWKEFNGDPDVLRARVVNPNRVVVLAPGEAWKLSMPRR